MSSSTRGRNALRWPLALLLVFLLVMSAAPAAFAAVPSTQEGPTTPDAPSGAKFVQPDRNLTAGPPTPLQAPATVPQAPTLQPGPLLACGTTSAEDFTTWTGELRVVRQCSLVLPQAGHVYITANSTVTGIGGDVTAGLGVGIDSTVPLTDVERRVSVSPTGIQNKSGAVSTLKSVTSGSHTFYFLAQIVAGWGGLQLGAPNISVVFIPDAAGFATCNTTLDGAWTSEAGTPTYVVRCLNFNTPSAGYIFFASNASIRNQVASYETRFWLEIDGSYQGATSRWQNSYPNGMGGSHDTFAITGSRRITSGGTHDFSLVAQRLAGSGLVTFDDPNVTLFFVPDSVGNIQQCSDLPTDSWYNPFYDWYRARECAIWLPQRSMLLLSGDASWGLYKGSDPLPAGPYETQVRLGIDLKSGDPSTTRGVSVVDDGTPDMSDMNYAATALRRAGPGSHIIYLSARKTDGAGTPTLTRGGLTVLAIPDLVVGEPFYLPLIAR